MFLKILRSCDFVIHLFLPWAIVFLTEQHNIGFTNAVPLLSSSWNSSIFLLIAPKFLCFYEQAGSSFTIFWSFALITSVVYLLTASFLLPNYLHWTWADLSSLSNDLFPLAYHRSPLYCFRSLNRALFLQITPNQPPHFIHVIFSSIFWVSYFG